MRETPIPLLRDLRPCAVICRCEFCNELMFMDEACDGLRESRLCPSREEVDTAAVAAA